MGKLSRNKGAAWEREVARRLTQATGTECKRCLIETQQGNSGDIVTALPLAVQCKVGAKPPVWDALKEAQEVAGEHEIPVAILKRNQKKPGQGCEEVAVVPLEDFLRMAKALFGPMAPKQGD